MSLSAVAASGTRKRDSARHMRTTPSSLDSAYSCVKASMPLCLSREARIRVTSSVASASVPARSAGDSRAFGIRPSTTSSSSASHTFEMAGRRSAGVMEHSGRIRWREFYSILGAAPLWPTAAGSRGSRPLIPRCGCATSKAMNQPETVSTIADLRARIAGWRREGRRVGLVPTMGALHEGHLSLMRDMAARTDKVVVSIFVNPAQFAPHEDFDRYPRALTDDMAKIETTAAVDLVFAPSVAEMYPDGFATKIEIAGPALGLETDFRPHFFSGVATLVAKLLIAAMPDVAIFGEKDYQQLLVVRRLVADLRLPIEIPGGAIVREKDGLAMSSRNAYLDPNERKIAGNLNRILKDISAK